MIEVYTIGNTSSYDKSIAEDSDNCFKLGKSENYEGGWIWKNPDEAINFINSKEFLNVNWGDGKPRNPERFSVYCVIIKSWNDVSMPDKDGIYHLLIDSKFYKL